MLSCNCNEPYIGPSLSNTCYGGSFILFMSILDTLIRNTCDVSEICARIAPTLQPDPEYDFVVIGGGSAGAVVASRLSEIPEWRVLLIEAGADEPPGSQVPSMMANFRGNTSIDWNYRTEPQEMACLGFPERRCTWPRGRVLGGSGVLNGMMYMRGFPQDYDDWENNGNPGWSYKDVLPFFKMSEGNEEIGLFSEDLHGSAGPMTTVRFPSRPKMADDVLKGAQELGYLVVNDLNDEPFVGFTVAQANIRNGSRLSSARAFLRPARYRPNLHIMINSTATKLILRNNNGEKTISRVEYIFQNQTYSVRVKREAVVSAGTINSPQILLLSGIGPEEILGSVNITQVHDLQGVGQNFQNHVSFNLNFLMTKVKATNDLNWWSVEDYLVNRRGLMSSSGMAQVTARICTANYTNAIQLFFNGYVADCAVFGKIGEPEDLSQPFAFKNLTITPVVLKPRSRGYVGLHSADPLEPPLMQPNFLSREEDVKTLIEGIRIALGLAGSNILADEYGLELVRESYGDCATRFSFNSDEFWGCAVRYFTGPENHQCGTCRMGPASDPLAVVDSKLQVHGIAGLRVIDASIMPSILAGNPHATVVMIAEKGSDYIKQKWKTK